MEQLTADSQTAQETKKRCSRCNREKYLDEFDKDNSKISGRNSHCRVCRRDRQSRGLRRPYRTRVAQPSQVTPGFKFCTRCQQEKPLDIFWKDKRRKDGLFGFCIPCAQTGKIQTLKANSDTSLQKKEGAYIFKSSSIQENISTDLSFLASIKKTSKLSWTYEQASLFVNGLKDAHTSGIIDLKRIASRYGSGKSLQGCRSLLLELKKANADGMTLEAYFKADRPHKIKQAKVIVGPKGTRKK